MKILFFNRFFFPDASATSQILSDLAFHLAASGRDVHVVTSRIPGDASDGGIVRDVTVHRIATPVEGPHGLPRRALAYCDYYLGARRAAMRLVSSGDLVVLKTDPPLLSASIAHLAKGQGGRVIVWLQDLFPEVAREYGVPGMRGPLGAWLRHIRDSSLAEADAVVAIGDRMAERVRERGCVPPERLHVIHNWADGKAITPIGRDASRLRRPWGLEGCFVVSYSGNLGRVHEFDTLLDAAARLRAQEDIAFLIVGRGPRLAEVRAHVEREHLANVIFHPHQERAMLAQSLGVADVHICVLRPEFEGLVHPSKLYGIMAAGRPTLFVGDVTGETGRILAQSGAGLAVPRGDGPGLAAAILRLRDDCAAGNAMGERARRAFAERYDMPVALARWEALVCGFEGNSPPADVGSTG